MALSDEHVLIGKGLKLGLEKPSYIGLLGFKVLDPGNSIYRDIMPEAFMVYTAVHAQTPLSAWKSLTKYGEALRINCLKKNQMNVEFTGMCDMLPVYEEIYKEYMGQTSEVLDMKYADKGKASEWLRLLPDEEELREWVNVSIMPGFKSNGMYVKPITRAAVKMSVEKRVPVNSQCECYVAFLSFAEDLKKSEAVGNRKCKENDMIRLYFASSADEAIKMAQTAGELEEKICEDFPNMPYLYFYGLWGICKVNKHPLKLCELFHSNTTIEAVEPVSYQTIFDRGFLSHNCSWR